MRKKIIAFIFLLGFMPMVTLAAVNVDSLGQGQGLKEYREARNTTEKIQKLQDVAKLMIERRVLAMEAAKNRLSTAKKISQETKDAVTKTLDDSITKINALEEEILATNDLAALKTKVKSIVTDFRIYVVILPQSHGLMAADRLQAYEQKLDELKAKTQTKVSELKDSGKDVASLESLLEQATAKLNETKTSIETAEAKFSSMQVSDVAGARTLKLEGKEALVLARDTLRRVRDDLQNVIKGIKDLNKPQE